MFLDQELPKFETVKGPTNKIRHRIGPIIEKNHFNGKYVG